MEKSALLFFICLASGAPVLLIKNAQKVLFKPALVFSGSFFLAITILHILPEIYSQPNFETAGIFVITGYFLQQIIESFTSGVEHGHLHLPNGSMHNHKSAFGLLFGLGVHSILEGSILTHNYDQHAHHAGFSVLSSLLLHKATASFALMTVVVCQFKQMKTMWIILILFSLASPLGYFISDYSHKTGIISENFLSILYALVAGSFLHISTTIFFESSPGHEHKNRNFIAASLGAFLAVASEYLI